MSSKKQARTFMHFQIGKQVNEIEKATLGSV